MHGHPRAFGTYAHCAAGCNLHRWILRAKSCRKPVSECGSLAWLGRYACVRVVVMEAVREVLSSPNHKEISVKGARVRCASRGSVAVRAPEMLTTPGGR